MQSGRRHRRRPRRRQQFCELPPPLPLSQLGSPITWTATAWTVMLVARMPASGTASDRPIYFNEGGAVDPSGFGIQVARSGTGSSGVVSVVAMGETQSCTLSAGWSDSTWTFVTLVMSGTTLKVYEGAFTSASPAALCTLAFSGASDAAVSFTTPHAYLGYEGGSGFTGQIAALAVWPDQALSGQQLYMAHFTVKLRAGAE
jgi:hypothetical protein